MEKCRHCNSERPLNILDTDYKSENDVPYQLVFYGCGNKKCPEYNKPAYKETINLKTKESVEFVKL